jgi:hypothetical protein
MKETLRRGRRVDMCFSKTCSYFLIKGTYLVAICHGVGKTNSTCLAACLLADLHFYQPQAGRLIACDRSLISNCCYVSCSSLWRREPQLLETLQTSFSAGSATNEHKWKFRVFNPSTPKPLKQLRWKIKLGWVLYCKNNEMWEITRNKFRKYMHPHSYGHTHILWGSKNWVTKQK